MSSVTQPRRAAALAGLVLLAASVPSCTVVPAEPIASDIRRVVLVSIDGLRADAIPHMPSLDALRPRSLWSDSMMTVVPSLTVPGHLSMFTGRDVTTMGIETNTLDANAALALMLNGATSVFEWVRTVGGRSVGIVGAGLVPPADLAAAQSFFGLDALTAAPEATSAIIDDAIGVGAGSDAPELLFVHLGAADAAGHVGGWTDEAGELSLDYIAAVRAIDAELARLITALEPAIDDGRAAIIITADHGGGSGIGCVEGIPARREHCTDAPADRLVPFLMVGRDIAPARLPGHPAITQVAPTIARLLQLDRPGLTAAPVTF